MPLGWAQPKTPVMESEVPGLRHDTVPVGTTVAGGARKKAHILFTEYPVRSCDGLHERMVLERFGSSGSAIMRNYWSA
jgi:hypothetical protein